MDPKLEGKLVVAISSRALFDLDEAHQVFASRGLDEYRRYQSEREDQVLAPGTGFPLVKGLLGINQRVGRELVEVVLVSRNDADTGLRVMNSTEAMELPIERAVFTDGRHPFEYLKPFSSHLFLSANEDDVAQALNAGFAAGLVYKPPYPVSSDPREVRIAFDGDAVLFSPEAEDIYREHGLEEFHRRERESAEVPLNPGPFKPFLEALHRIQRLFPEDECPIRTALVTARGAPAHKRAIMTLRAWEIKINEAFFLGGVGKEGVLNVFSPHIFFDDQSRYCEPASTVTPTARVPLSFSMQGGEAPEDSKRQTKSTVIENGPEAPSIWLPAEPRVGRVPKARGASRKRTRRRR